MIFPMCSLLSIRRWAPAASASGNRECTIGLIAPRFDQRPHLRLERPRDGPSFCSTVRGAEGGPGDRQPPEHDGQHVELLDLRAVLHRDDHEPALGGETLQIPREVVAGDHVEHHVDAASAGECADALDEIFLAVVDCSVRLRVRGTGVAFRLRPRGDVDGPRRNAFAS